MQKYVLGFMFSEDRKVVALILKNKPEWQKGKLNGIGGKVEKGETSYEAMAREFMEETGVWNNEWKMFHTMGDGKTWECDCFVAFDNNVFQCSTQEEEKIRLVETFRCVCLNVHMAISNLKWLIPLALYEENTLTSTMYITDGTEF